MAGFKVVFSALAVSQVQALPGEARELLADALQKASVSPYDAGRYDPRFLPDMRTLVFGDWGLVTYLVSERQQRVSVLEVTWAGA